MLKFNRYVIWFLSLFFRIFNYFEYTIWKQLILIIIKQEIKLEEIFFGKPFTPSFDITQI